MTGEAGRDDSLGVGVDVSVEVGREDPDSFITGKEHCWTSSSDNRIIASASDLGESVDHVEMNCQSWYEIVRSNDMMNGGKMLETSVYCQRMHQRFLP